MGFLGSQRNLTPNLDQLARQGVVFTHAYSHVPLTTASHATILTGTYPQFNHVNDFGVPLSARLPYLPDILRHRGYHTAALMSTTQAFTCGRMEQIDTSPSSAAAGMWWIMRTQP